MKIVGLLSAYDESPSWLSAAVAGFGRVCDAIVYADGAYALYPGARPRSHPEQAEAVLSACEAADVECLIHRPSDVYWGNEVEKRNKTLALAAALEPDWVLVFDGDFLPMRVEPEIVRAELERTRLNAATYTIIDGKDLLADETTAALARDQGVSTQWTIRIRDIFRWTPDLRYVRTHFMVRGTYDGVEQWVKGPEIIAAETDEVSTPAHDLNAALVAVHRTQHRTRDRREASEGYYRNRDVAGVESLEGVLA